MIRLALVLLSLAAQPSKIQGRIQDFQSQHEILVDFAHGQEAAARRAVTSAGFQGLNRLRGDSLRAAWRGGKSQSQVARRLHALEASEAVTRIIPLNNTKLPREPRR